MISFWLISYRKIASISFFVEHLVLIWKYFTPTSSNGFMRSATDFLGAESRESSSLATKLLMRLRVGVSRSDLLPTRMQGS